MNQFERVKKVIEFLADNQQSQPSLDELSKHLGISTFHLHRVFSEWAGTTPKAFLKCLTLEHAKTMLQNESSVLDATLASGLSGPGRLHDLCVSIEAASPGEIKSGGLGLKTKAGFVNSPFGHCLIAKNQRGICHISFEPDRNEKSGLEIVRAEWPNSKIDWDNAVAERIASKLFAKPHELRPDTRLNAFVRGTNFQLRVWRALLRMPFGALTTYGRVAEEIGNPKSSRAVGTAIGNNPIAFLIPCHRVIRSTGVLGDYRWGPERKKAVLAWEYLQAEN